MRKAVYNCTFGQSIYALKDTHYDNSMIESTSPAQERKATIFTIPSMLPDVFFLFLAFADLKLFLTYPFITIINTTLLGFYFE